MTPPSQSSNWLHRITTGLSKSSKRLGDALSGVSRIDEESLEALEDVLITTDMGPTCAAEMIDALRAHPLRNKLNQQEIRDLLAEKMVHILKPVTQPLSVQVKNCPHIILVVGVNGAGKTTTVGKLAAQMTQGGQSVILVAGDTFRAAAIEQLKVWGDRTDCPVVARSQGSDSASLAFEGCEQARRDGANVMLMDTAGRLHTKTDLMDELAKIIRVIKKFDPEAPHDTVLVLDATTGQNSLSQIEAFRQCAPLSGLIMTKLDGTARGGILLQVAQKYPDLPIFAIGIGEAIDDLTPFDPLAFARSLTGTSDITA